MGILKHLKIDNYQRQIYINTFIIMLKSNKVKTVYS